MAGRSKYTDKERAQVYVTLKANSDNVKRTVRDTGIPENTVRRWRDEWRNGINVPDVSTIVAETDKFVTVAERIRDDALGELDIRIKSGQVRTSELITVVGVLDDKISRARGIDRDRNLHVHHHLPSAEEIKEMMGGFVKQAIGDAHDADIIEGQIVGRKALPDAQNHP